MKDWLLILLLGLLGLILWNAPYLGAVPDTALLEWIDAGEKSQGGTAGAIIFFAFEKGGLPVANGVRNFFPLIAGCALLVIVTGIAAGVLHRFPLKKKRICRWIQVLLVLSVLWGAIRMEQAIRWTLREPALSLPIQLVESVRKSAAKGPVLATPPAALALQYLAPELSVDRDPEAMQTLANPSLWRQQDREKRYAAVLLTGPVSDFQPVLDHLLQSPDWVPAALDAHGFLFLRGPSTSSKLPATLQIPKAVESNPAAAAMFRARTALYFAAAGNPGYSRKLFREALDLAPKNPDILAMHASFLAGRGQWKEASHAANESLKLKKNHPQALQVVVQAELAADNLAAAWNAAETLKRKMPADPFSLFLHARAANAAGAAYAEAESLERLILLTRKAGLPAANYQIYLGQALARQGFGKLAQDQWREALASGLLSEEKTEQVITLIENVESQVSENRLPSKENLP